MPVIADWKDLELDVGSDIDADGHLMISIAEIYTIGAEMYITKDEIKKLVSHLQNVLNESK